VFAGRYRPSTFLTLTLDSYGRVNNDGAAVDLDRYDYRRAARDAIHFPALIDSGKHPPLRRVGRAVLRHRRTAKTRNTAFSCRDPRCHFSRGITDNHCGHLSPSLGFQKLVTYAEQQLYAARSYSLIKPPRTE
jgi:hypothetical protein